MDIKTSKREIERREKEGKRDCTHTCEKANAALIEKRAEKELRRKRKMKGHSHERVKARDKHQA